MDLKRHFQKMRSLSLKTVDAVIVHGLSAAELVDALVRLRYLNYEKHGNCRCAN